MENHHSIDGRQAGSSAGCEAMEVETNGDPQSEGSVEPLCFSNFSIAMKASSEGIEDLSKDVCQYLADELSFKTKELIYTAKFIMTRNKRTTLTTNDVQRAMKLLGGCEVFGQSSQEPPEFLHVPELDLYVEKDSVIDVVDAALEETVFEQRPDPYIQGAWIMPEGYAAESSVPPSNNSYYRTIVNTIMSGSPAHIKVALRDLRTNPKIGPLCPYFLNLVALTVKRIAMTANRADKKRENGEDTPSSDVDNINLTNTLISTVHAIAHNRYVDPSPYRAVNRAVDSLLKLVTDNNVGKTFDDLAVRFRAGLLLAKVVITWSIELKQQMDIVRRLLQHLLDPKRPLQSHYGAIVALTALGQRTYDFYFWPVIDWYLPQLEVRAAKDPDVMVQHVMAAILVAARSTHQKEPTSLEQLLILYRVDQRLYFMFGDSVTPLRMATNSIDQHVYPVVKATPRPVPPVHKYRLTAPAFPHRIRHRPPLPLAQVFELPSGVRALRPKTKQVPHFPSNRFRYCHLVPHTKYRRLARSKADPTSPQRPERSLTSPDLLWML